MIILTNNNEAIVGANGDETMDNRNGGKLLIMIIIVGDVDQV